LIISLDVPAVRTRSAVLTMDNTSGIASFWKKLRLKDSKYALHNAKYEKNR